MSAKGISEEAVEKFERMIADAMMKLHVPGLSVALVRDGEVIYARGFGARNREENLPATPNTLYGIGSCTKSFTALAIMQLVERGKLSLEDPVSKYLPIRVGSKEDPIRIHHLLTHSSGIPNLGVAEIIIGKMVGIEEKWIPMSSLEDLFLHINGAVEEVAARPGERFFYFNTGYTLLGEIIERVSGVSYEEYVRENILKPLEMKRSTFLKEEFEKDPDIMTPYIVEEKDGEVAITPTKHPFHKFVYAAGGLLSSVMELSNYLTMNMNGGAFKGTRILDSSLLTQMHEIGIESETLQAYYGRFGRTGYGYGWIIAEDFLGHKLVAHGGSTGVSSAHLSFIPDLKIGVAAAANTGQGPVPVYLGALALLMGKDPEKEIPAIRIEKRLNMLAGVYESYKGIHRVSVVKRGALLFLESKERLWRIRAPLIPESEELETLKFYIVAGPGQRFPVEFVVDPSGRVDLYLERHRLHKVGGLEALT